MPASAQGERLRSHHDRGRKLAGDPCRPPPSWSVGWPYYASCPSTGFRTEILSRWTWSCGLRARQVRYPR